MLHPGDDTALSGSNGLIFLAVTLPPLKINVAFSRNLG
jgi:hypothetical protein